MSTDITPAQAWEAWAEHGTQRQAAESLGISPRTLFDLVEVWRARHPGQRKPPSCGGRPSEVEIAAWLAWEAHGSQVAAADALGITRNGLIGRVSRYRSKMRLPISAVPTQASQPALVPLTREQMEEISRIHAATRSVELTAERAGVSLRMAYIALGSGWCIRSAMAAVDSGAPGAQEELAELERQLYGAA